MRLILCLLLCLLLLLLCADACSLDPQSRALLSSVVFVGTLRSVLVPRGGHIVRARFALDRALKGPPRSGVELVYRRRGRCPLDHDTLQLGAQYLVYGSPEPGRPFLVGSAPPIPNDKRTLRKVQRVLCPGCAKAPNVTGLHDATVPKGTKIRLNCHVTGNPIPWVEWYKDGTKITGRGRLRVKTKRRTSRLVIRKAVRSDGGVYECRAGNVVSEETVSATATVNVTDRIATTTQSSPWTTEPCPTGDFCLNGGTCVFYRDVGEYVCHCAEGYVGLRCDYKDVRFSHGKVKKYRSRGDIP